MGRKFLADKIAVVLPLWIELSQLSQLGFVLSTGNISNTNVRTVIL